MPVSPESGVCKFMRQLYYLESAEKGKKGKQDNCETRNDR